MELSAAIGLTGHCITSLPSFVKVWQLHWELAFVVKMGKHIATIKILALIFMLVALGAVNVWHWRYT